MIKEATLRKNFSQEQVQDPP